MSDKELIGLANASKSENYGKKMTVRCVVAGKDLAPYIIPKTFVFKCCKESGAMKKCQTCCAVNNLIERDSSAVVQSNHEVHKKELEFDYHKDIIATIVGQSNEKMTRLLEEKFSPIKCQYLFIDIMTTQNIEDTSVIPEISFEYKDNEYVVRQALVLGDSINTNAMYNLTGTIIPSPKSQQALHIIEKAEQTSDNIQSFELDSATINKLSVFRSDDDIGKKLGEIYHDFTYNVTNIYNREDLMFAIDLVYHSALSFDFLGQRMMKGWLECLIIGDTRTGKSQTAMKMMSHYRMGELVSGENTSLAGLLAGLQQTNKRWALMWGKIPLNDRRLLVVDEASGLTDDDFSKLSSVRSSGIAEITKIQMLKTFARTRLIWISNPRTRKLNEYSYGVLAVKELFGKQEDISRLDYALSVSLEEVPDEIINKRHNEEIRHRYDSDLCNLLLRFAWSRSADDIVFTKEAEDRVLELASELSRKYSNIIPLINSAESRIKLAKMSVALAIRTFNLDEKTLKIVVEPRHVDFIKKYIDSIYSKNSMGYDMYSEQRYKENTIKDDSILSDHVDSEDKFSLLLDGNRFVISDFQDIFNLDKDETKNVVGKMMRMRAIRKVSNFYVKTPAFIRWLKDNKDKKPEPKEGELEL